MKKKGGSSLYLKNICATEKELAIKWYMSTLWGYDKVLA